MVREGHPAVCYFPKIIPYVLSIPRLKMNALIIIIFLLLCYYKIIILFLIYFILVHLLLLFLMKWVSFYLIFM